MGHGNKPRGGKKHLAKECGIPHYVDMGYMIEATELYEAWYETLTAKKQAQIEKRLANVQQHGHFGHTRQLDKNLAEIKFNDGTRIYFTIKREGKTVVLLLLGGNKNGQDKDIAKAKALLNR